MSNTLEGEIRLGLTKNTAVSCCNNCHLTVSQVIDQRASTHTIQYTVLQKHINSVINDRIPIIIYCVYNLNTLNIRV